MVREATDVLIVGAGAAGLAAARELSAAGLRVVVLEARGRIGGRIYTLEGDGACAAVELGAEFVHGRPPETWELVERAGLVACDVSDEHWYLRGGVLTKSDESWSELGEIMRRMKETSGGGNVGSGGDGGNVGSGGDARSSNIGNSDGGGSDGGNSDDRSFQSFLEEHFAGERWREARALATRYVQGFHASSAGRISVRGLVQANDAAESINDDKQFRLLGGYRGLVEWLRAQLDARRVVVRLGRVVTEVRWRRGAVELSARVGEGDGVEQFEASRLLLTLPLGVWQSAPGEAGAVRFEPELTEKTEAARRLEMGQVVRLTFRFRDRFWEALKLPSAEGRESLSEMGFIHSDNEWLPTWWTQAPVRAPLLTAWVGGAPAERLLARGEEFIVARALDDLSKLLGVARTRIEELVEGSYMHNWQTDAFARGAYSYVPVGGLDAPQQLARPVEETLFFAGEATDTEGHRGTVHAALATGRRAARELLDSLKSH